MSNATDAQPTTDSPPLLAKALAFAGSSVGAKFLMALSGVGLCIFIVAHLAGNLLVFAGPEAFNGYARALHANALVLWGGRAMMVTSIIAHLYFTVRTVAMNRAARPTPYARGNNSPTSFALSSRAITGGLILVYMGYHLAHFTWHWVHRENIRPLDDGSVDAYFMLVSGFSQAPIALLYIVANGFLGLHLSNSVYSMLQHLGFWGESFTPALKKFSLVFGWGIALLFISIPAAVLMGMVKPS